MTNVLLLDADGETNALVSAMAAEAGLSCKVVTTLKAATEWLCGNDPQLLLMNSRLPDGGGLELLIDNCVGDDTEVYVLHQNENEQFIGRCIRLGVENFLRKPLDDEELRLVLNKCSSMEEEPKDGCRDNASNGFGMMLRESRPMKKLYKQLRRVAKTDVPVLIIGESGTGKERAATSIHMASPRANKPFVPVNCGAIASELVESQLFGHEKGAFTGAHSSHDGFFRQAEGGTLFLDELTEMDIDLQVKLLRALESGRIRPVGGSKDIPIDVRILVATNRNPDEAIEEGKLRQDLYYRIAAFPITLPPLRNRGADIVLLSKHILAELCEEHGREIQLSDEASDSLRIHDWPGNVRELKNAITRAYIMSDREIDEDTLPDAVLNPNRPSGDFLRLRIGESIAEAEKKLILATLDYYDGDKTKTAKELGISIKTLYNRMKEYEEETARQA